MYTGDYQMKYLLETMLARKEVTATDVLSRVNFIISGLFFIFFLLPFYWVETKKRKNILIISDFHNFYFGDELGPTPSKENVFSSSQLVNPKRPRTRHERKRKKSKKVKHEN
jgi:hypothetical protein